MTRFEVHVCKDLEAGVWVAHSEDIQGLNTEGKNFDEVVARVMAVAPELIELNHIYCDPDGGEIHIVAEHRELLVAA